MKKTHTKTQKGSTSKFI